MIENFSKDEKNKIIPGLYIVPTPIGNLDDITLRALKVLSIADIIACEDTRNAGKLLNHYGIYSKRLESYFEHNEIRKAQFLVNEIITGRIVALITDAGTPGISDPAYRIINEAIKNNIQIFPLPGATALIPALIGSGFATDSFKFVGFPPHKKGRKTFLKNISEEKTTTIMYESSHRIEKLIDELIEICGDGRKACVARELTKVYEEFLRGNLIEIKMLLNDKNKTKGEFVVVLEGFDK